jgi:hypothetical protein
MRSATNATKANLIAVANAALGLAVLFGVPLTEEQTGGILGLLNALGVLWVGLTYKDSPARDPRYDA